MIIQKINNQNLKIWDKHKIEIIIWVKIKILIIIWVKIL